jgi:hypothetical protein
MPLEYRLAPLGEPYDDFKFKQQNSHNLNLINNK